MAQSNEIANRWDKYVLWEVRSPGSSCMLTGEIFTDLGGPWRLRGPGPPAAAILCIAAPPISIALPALRTSLDDFRAILRPSCQVRPSAVLTFFIQNFTKVSSSTYEPTPRQFLPLFPSQSTPFFLFLFLSLSVFTVVLCQNEIELETTTEWHCRISQNSQCPRLRKRKFSVPVSRQNSLPLHRSTSNATLVPRREYSWQFHPKKSAARKFPNSLRLCSSRGDLLVSHVHRAVSVSSTVVHKGVEGFVFALVEIVHRNPRHFTIFRASDVLSGISPTLVNLGARGMFRITVLGTKITLSTNSCKRIVRPSTCIMDQLFSRCELSSQWNYLVYRSQNREPVSFCQSR